MLRSSNNVRFGFSLTEYPGGWAKSASRFRVLVGPGRVMGPEWLNFTVAMQEADLVSVWTRDDYVSDAASIDGQAFMLAQRRAVRSVWTDGTPSPELGEALTALRVRGVCAPPDKAQPFLDFGFERRGELGRAGERCIVLTRAARNLGPARASSSPGRGKGAYDAL